jgi:hypothetical protein
MTKRQLRLGAFMLRENLGLPRPKNRFFEA